MKLTKTANRILKNKYLLKTPSGELAEDFNALCLRVAWAIAGAEETDALRKGWAATYYQVMNELWFLPGGRILANAGRPGAKNLFNCYVLGVKDSRESIYRTLLRSAEIFAHGGGIGYNLSNIRERGSPVSNGSRASGPVSFLELFDVSAGVISQASRRGAQIAILDIDHPDIRQFIHAKETEGCLTHFNLSVGITDDFMRALTSGVTEYKLISRYHSPNRYHNFKPCNIVNPVELLHELAETAWRTGDPGILFTDAIGRGNAAPHLGRLNTTNPCGEAPLLPNEACCLGSINLVKMLTRTPEGLVFDIDKLSYAVTVAVRFLDSIHDVNKPVLPQIGRACLNTRKIGLGVMGWADVLALLGLAYDSQEARLLAAKVGEQMRGVAYETSKFLADEKSPYPGYNVRGSQNVWPQGNPVEPTRNAMLLCFQPTGTISLIAGVNSGIEPFFALKYTKNVTEGAGEVKYTIEEHNGYEGEIKTAHDISPADHIRMQAVWQNFVDGAVSKTINLPHDTTVEEVKEAIVLGWRLGLKGMTLFRDRCRKFQILNVEE